MSGRLPIPERMAKTETITERLKSDFNELKSKMSDMEEDVQTLIVSNALQTLTQGNHSDQLAKISKSLEELQQSTKALIGTVNRAQTGKDLDKDITSAVAGMSFAKIKSYFMAGTIIAGVLWSLYGMAVQASKPNTKLLDEHGHVDK